jgi:hypothetical protein
MTKEVKIKVIQPFHLSNHFSIMSVKGSFIPLSNEFSATSLYREVNHCRTLVIVPLGAVLFGIYVQHETPIIMQSPPFLINIMSTASLFFQAI